MTQDLVSVATSHEDDGDRLPKMITSKIFPSTPKLALPVRSLGYVAIEHLVPKPSAPSPHSSPSM